MNLQELIKKDYKAISQFFEAQGSVNLLQKAYQSAIEEARKHGRFEQWKTALEALPDTSLDVLRLDTDAVQFHSNTVFDEAKKAAFERLCQEFIPWRKGPFDLFGLAIDTEWRSHLKWARLEKHVDLSNKRVLDVGCGNAYYAWRMLGAGAKAVLGIDPYVLYWFQYLVFSRYHFAPQNLAVLPMTLEAFPEKGLRFDTVFSMGVLYHRRSPIEHLERLKKLLEKGGQLILETLVVEGNEHTCLFPEGRYANMKNVWFIPSCLMLEKWLKRCKFIEIEKIDDAMTGMNEQRKTAWMPFHSLEDALNEADATLTIEGHPAPRRVVYSARTGYA